MHNIYIYIYIYVYIYMHTQINIGIRSLYINKYMFIWAIFLP